jgi:hypothetical protein
MRQFEQLKLRYETTSARLCEVVSSLKDHLGDVEEEPVQSGLSVRVRNEPGLALSFEDGCCSAAPLCIEDD